MEDTLIQAQNPPLPSSPVTTKRWGNNIFIIVALLFSVVTGTSGYYLGRNSVTNEKTPSYPLPSSSPGQDVVACTTDAKVCPDGTAVGRTGPDCEFATCPQSTFLPDERLIGSLPYSYVKKVETGKNWVERGIPLNKDSLREFVSSDQCGSIIIRDMGPLDTDVESFAAKYYQIPSVPINPEALYTTQYKINGYQSITVGPMGMGEISNTVVGVRGRVIGINSVLNASNDPETSGLKCIFPETSAKELIESIQF